MSRVWSGVATLTGTIIGAGIFAIPYVIAKAGLWTGLLIVLIVGGVMLLVNLMLGEVILRTHDHHQLSGLAEKYLGKKGKHLMAMSMLVGVYGALVAYIIGAGESFAVLFGGSPGVWSAIFFLIMSLLLLKGIKVLTKAEGALAIAKALLFLGVIIVLFTQPLKYDGLASFNLGSIMLPFGVVLFAFLGTAAVPEVEEGMHKSRKYLKKALLIGSIIPIIAYSLFAIGVIGITGRETTEVATVGISQLLGPGASLLLNGFAAVAMTTAYLGLSFAVRDTFRYDYKLKDMVAWILTIIIPVAIIVLGAKSFVGAIEIAGSFGGGLAGILIVLMHGRRGTRKPEYTINVPKWAKALLIAFFIVGALMTVF